jgi:hypothetical protein
MRDARCSYDTYKRAIAWAEEQRELARDVNKGDAPKAAEGQKPNRFRFLHMGAEPARGATCGGVQERGVQEPPPDPSLVLDPVLSSSSVFQGAELDGDDEQRVDVILRLFADRQTAKHATSNPAGFKRTALRNARLEHAGTVRDWLSRFDVSDTQVADALVGGGVPSSWNNCRRPA